MTGSAFYFLSQEHFLLRIPNLPWEFLYFSFVSRKISTFLKYNRKAQQKSVSNFIFYIILKKFEILIAIFYLETYILIKTRSKMDTANKNSSSFFFCVCFFFMTNLHYCNQFQNLIDFTKTHNSSSSFVVIKKRKKI